MDGDCPDDESTAAVPDEERLLLFEWHAAHLESWLEEFPPPVSVNIPYGMSAREFHTATMLVALLRKFYSRKDRVSLGPVIDAFLRLSTNLPRDVGKQLKRLRTEYARARGPLDNGGRYKVDGEDYRSSVDYMWDVAYGLLIHDDPAKGERLRKAGRMVHGAVNIPEASETVAALLASIREGRHAGSLRLPAPYPPVWLPATRDDVTMTLEQADEFLGR